MYRVDRSSAHIVVVVTMLIIISASCSFLHFLLYSVLRWPPIVVAHFFIFLLNVMHSLLCKAYYPAAVANIALE